MEELFELDSDDDNYDKVIQAIDYFRENPINLATATPDLLMQLKILSFSQALRIYDISRKPDFKYSFLSDSLNLSPELKLIIEECTYYKQKKIKNISRKIISRNRYIDKFEKVYGFRNDKFKGNELDLLNRFIITYDKFNFGFITNKNYGEMNITEFYSGYAEYSKKNFRFIAGDYNLDLAGGTLFSGAFGKRKSASNSSEIIFMGSGISPNQSSMVNSYFRGLSASGNIFLPVGILKLTGLYSNINKAATLGDDDTVTSIYQSGYFRTENEIMKKNKLNEQIIGTDLNLSFKNYIIGLNSYYLKYNKLVNTDAQSQFSGKTGLFKSAYFYYNNKNNFINSEIAFDPNNNLCAYISWQFVNRSSKYAINIRNISPYFRSPYGNIISENSYLSNEFGIYSGAELNINKYIDIKFYSDLYQTHLPTFFIPFPVNGLDLFTESDIYINQNNSILIRLKSENKSKASKNYEINAKTVVPLRRNFLRFDFIHKHNSNLRLRTRLEYTVNSKTDILKYESGFLTFLQLIYSNKDFSFNGRFTIFDTDSYNSAIWLFEYAVPGYLTTVPIYNSGYRVTLRAKYSILKYFDLSIRYSAMWKNNTDEIGSGYDAINQNHRSGIMIQLDTKINY